MGAQGRRRIKLGLKEVVNVGELTQHIDVATQHTVRLIPCTLASAFLSVLLPC